MSNTEQMVSMPREWVENYAGLLEERCAYEASERVQALLAQPAAQHQGEPVAMPARKDPTDGWAVPGGVHKAEGWNACLDEIAKLGRLYTHPDAGELKRLNCEVSKWRGTAGRLNHERDTLRAQLDAEKKQHAQVLELATRRWGVIAKKDAQLADRDALLLEAMDVLSTARRGGNYFSAHDRIKAALSASAEPSAPKCKCDMRTRLVGDGCETCNPELASELIAPAEVLSQEDGVLTFMRESRGMSAACKCCDGAHVFCRYFKGMSEFNDLTQAVRFRNDLEGRSFRVTLQLLPVNAALERKP